ncbi:MmgE/PrpD family protein [Microbacterium aoyamense]|uniref:MmgE/PrpD family protein n=1 Tax=Microbacterium aoyamense TaxID=344166 RepID=A0ABN2PBJ0_9MICO|nr:MmgE/PrpD family protein [Microbacterium aoyamense]
MSGQGVVVHEDSPENGTAILAEFAAGLTFDDIPDRTVRFAKLLMLDNVGVALFGSTLPWSRLVQDMVEAEGARGVSTVFGSAERTSPALAALANAMAGHAFELDETHRDAGFHPGSMIWPTALAVAESRDAVSGKDLVTAAVAGYEVGCRVGMAGFPALFFRGFHPQGVVGPFAAAATAGRIIGLDARGMLDAIGVAGTQAAGLMAAQEGAMVKRLHSGRAAQSGVYGALLAERGFTGIQNVVEAGFGGFLSAISGAPTPDDLLRGLGETWETENNYYKPYATVASIQTSLDGLRSIMRDERLTEADIAHVDVGLGELTMVHCAWEYAAQGVTAAQMNLFYGLAAVALEGDAFIDQYREELLNDPRIIEFIGRISARTDDEIVRRGRAARHAAVVEVTTRDGARHRREIWHRRGTAENPPAEGDIEAKYDILAGRAIGDEAAAEVKAAIADIEKLDDLSAMLDPIRAARVQA